MGTFMVSFYFLEKHVKFNSKNIVYLRSISTITLKTEKNVYMRWLFNRLYGIRNKKLRENTDIEFEHYILKNKWVVNNNNVKLT